MQNVWILKVEVFWKHKSHILCLYIILQCFHDSLQHRKENYMGSFFYSIESHYVIHLALNSLHLKLSSKLFKIFLPLPFQFWNYGIHGHPKLFLLNYYFQVSLPSPLWWKLSVTCIQLTFWELMPTHAKRLPMCTFAEYCPILRLFVIICNQLCSW